MSGSKIRNIAIAALLVANLLFLWVIIYEAVQDVRQEREMVENVRTILYNGGIAIEPESIRVTPTQRAMRTSRVLEVEESIARVLLGDTVITDQGIIYRYENPRTGMAEFYSAGVFHVHIYPDVISAAGDAAATVSLLLREMGVETTRKTVELNEADDSETVTVTVAYRSSSIFNSAIEFVFIEGSLRYVIGRYVAGIEPFEDSHGISQVSSALLTFMAAVIDESREDIYCTEIHSVAAGFLHRIVGSFGEGLIEPAWLIETDNGVFIIEDLTGDIWRQ